MLRLQQLIAILIVAGTCLALFAKSDRYFPFSNYPMYSKLFASPVTYPLRAIRGVNQSGADERLRILRTLPPFWTASLREALLVDRSDDAIKSKLRATLNWYNRKLSETNSGAPLAAIRLYRYDMPWSDLTAAALENGVLDSTIWSHAQIQFEATP